jgi:hypothetical protein
MMPDWLAVIFITVLALAAIGVVVAGKFVEKVNTPIVGDKEGENRGELWPRENE